MLFRHDFRQRGRQRGLAVVNVTYRAYIDVWFRSFEFFLGHGRNPFLNLHLRLVKNFLANYQL
jgi:hypothetical protein